MRNWDEACAYALSLLRFPGRGLVFLVVIAALMVPNQITVISNYALVAQLGWRNTFQGIIVPLAGVAFGTFLMRNQFLSLPGEIIEAARLDGAGPLKLLWRVVLPMSWPTLVAFSLITVVNEWNEYLWPFLMSDDERTAPLPVGLTLLQNNDGEAVAAGRRATEASGDNPYAHYQLGLAAAGANDFDTASQEFVRATELKNDFAYAHYYAGQSLQKQRNLGKAAEHYQYFMQLAPDSPDRSAVQAIMRALRK